jgi:hypothetical protein
LQYPFFQGQLSARVSEIPTERIDRKNFNKEDNSKLHETVKRNQSGKPIPEIPRLNALEIKTNPPLKVPEQPKVITGNIGEVRGQAAAFAPRIQVSNPPAVRPFPLQQPSKPNYFAHIGQQPVQKPQALPSLYSTNVGASLRNKYY